MFGFRTRNEIIQTSPLIYREKAENPRGGDLPRTSEATSPTTPGSLPPAPCFRLHHKTSKGDLVIGWGRRRGQVQDKLMFF